MGHPTSKYITDSIINTVSISTRIVVRYGSFEGTEVVLSPEERKIIDEIAATACNKIHSILYRALR